MKLSKELIQKIILGIVGYIVLFTMFNNVILNKISSSSVQKKAALFEMQSAYDANIQKTGVMAEKKKEWMDKTKNYNDKQSAFISEKNKKTLLNEIVERAKQRNIRLESVDIESNNADNSAAAAAEVTYDGNGNPIEQATTVVYKPFIILLKLRSDFYSLLRYIDELEKMKKMISIRSLNIKRGENEIVVELKLKSYIIPEEGEKNKNGTESK